MGTEAASGTIPENVFLAFQMTFAVITPALIVGAFPERMKFSSILVFSVLWLLAVYVPVCHWVWGGGWLADMGIKDFAGGLVVHATAGVSALVLASLLGPRRGFPRELRPPHNPGMTAMGAAMLWVGWFGFNGGSQLAADGGAGMAILVTHLSASTAAVVWMLIEWVRFGRPSLVGFATGVIAGLATITPASGFVGPTGALIIGAAAGAICFYAVGVVKNALKIDDSLDVFAVHGVGGILGTLLLAVLMSPVFRRPGLRRGRHHGRPAGHAGDRRRGDGRLGRRADIHHRQDRGRIDRRHPHQRGRGDPGARSRLAWRKRLRFALNRKGDPA